ncbi:MAG TPA: hypothetical protein VKQ36_06130 [Ktedonobacterales bacterium]|nr:hypothetical protein [Ktedonobacterales bacterium]
MPDRHDPYAQQLHRLEDALLRGPGTLDTTTRASLAAGHDTPEPLAAYARKVALHAYQVTDDDIQALLAAGYSQDQIFEATLSVAFGVARLRLDAGLRALGVTASENESEEK